MFIEPPKLIIASSGPKTGSTLLARMFETAIKDNISENLMCAEMLEAGMLCWNSVSENEKSKSALSKHYFKKSLRETSEYLFNGKSVAKTTAFTQLKGLSHLRPEISFLNVYRPWQDTARSLYGFLKYSGTIDSALLKTTTPADTVISYVRNKIKKVEDNLTDYIPRVSYDEVLEMSKSSIFRRTKFLEWSSIWPWLKIDIDRVSSDYLTLPFNNRQGYSFLTPEDNQYLDNSIQRFEYNEKLIR